jgi:hypothetical protein
MQKVAWPTITVKRLSGTSRTWVKVLEIATPVTIPGRAIGRITKKEIVSRPKKRCRATASEARVPRTRAIAVAAIPALIEVKKASRAASSLNAWLNQWVVKPGGGHSRTLLELKA